MRTIYWSRALDVWQEHRLAGAGAGSFAQAQLRFRDQPTQGRHAHGYVHQTLADLGLLGLAASLAALAAWLLATRAHARICARPVAAGLDVRSAPGCWRLRWWRSCSACTRRSTGPGSCPAVAITGLFCAGWVAGRGPLALTAAERRSAETPAPVRLQMPRGRALRGRGRAGAPVRSRSPAWRRLPSRSRGGPTTRATTALALLSEGDFAGARAAADRAHDINPLSVEPYFERAAIEDAAGRPRRATRPLEDAVRLEPASPEAWRRLGEHYVADARPAGARDPRAARGPLPRPDLGAEPRAPIWWRCAPAAWSVRRPSLPPAPRPPAARPGERPARRPRPLRRRSPLPRPRGVSGRRLLRRVCIGCGAQEGNRNPQGRL